MNFNLSIFFFTVFLLIQISKSLYLPTQSDDGNEKENDGYFMEECEDAKKTCRFMANLCTLPGVRASCRLTCHLCPPPTYPVPSFGPSNCKNTIPACPTYWTECFQPEIQAKCPKTCRLC